MKLLNLKHIAAIVLCIAMALGAVSCGGVDFAVQFIVDGEIYATVHTTGSETITLPDNPDKEGYRFVGWYWDEGTWLEPFTANSLLDAPLASSMSVYARFKPLGTAGGEDDGNDGTGTTNPGGGDHGGGSNGGNGTQQPSVVGEAPVVGQAYLMAMEHGKLNKTYYMTGTLDGYYLGTTENKAEAPNFYFEAAGSDGEHDLFHLYAIVKGVKTYINLYKNGNYTNFKLETASDETVYYFDAAIGELVVVCEGEVMALGTSNTQTYTNVAARPYATVAESFIVKYVKSAQADQGGDAVTPPTVYNTPAEIIAAAEKLNDNEFLSDSYQYTLSGTITAIVGTWSDQHGNLSVNISVDGTEGKIVECFRLSGEGAKELKVGDHITVKGPIKMYAKADDSGNVTSRKIEFDHPVLLNVTAGTETPGYEIPTEIDVVDPVAGTAYHLALVQKNLGKVFYLTGAMDGYYLATTENIAEAANVYLEAVPDAVGQYYVFFVVNNARVYLNVFKNGSYNNFNLSDTAETAFGYSNIAKTLWGALEGKEIAFGTASTKEYSNITIRYADLSSFYVHFVDSTDPDAPIPGGGTTEPEPVIPSTPNEILDAAEALGANAYLADQYLFKLSGEIVEIISPWTEDFKNIRVLITVDGTDGRTIECFRLSGEGTEGLKVGDKITVSGPIKRYVNFDENGTVTVDKIEFDYPTLISVTPGEGGDVVIYETPAQIMEAAKLLAPGTYLSDGYAYTLSGKIQSVDVEFDTTYNNISVTILVDGTTDTIQAFRMTGDVAILPTLAIGDSITVKGPILMYENTSTGVLKLEFEKPTLESYTKGEGSGVSTPEIEALTPVVGTPYLFTLRQINAGKIMYFNGVMDSYYLGTTENKSEAVNVYIEETTGGYYLYCIKDGAKLYINLVLNGTHVNPAIESSAVTVYTYDATLGTLTASFNDATWLFGTSPSGTYLNAAARDASLENLVMQFTASDKVDPAPAEPQEITVAEFCEIALAQPNRGAATAEKYIIKGVITDIENIIYGNMTVEDETGTIFVYGVYDADGKNLFEDMAVKPKVGDTVVLLGVAGNYDRAQMQNGWIQEIIPGEGGEDDNIIYETPEEIVNAAYALAANLYLSKGIDYTLTGEIISIDTVYNASYGNITVTIVVGGMTDKPIMCYRLSGAGVEGLQVGDVITVTGPIKNYVRTDAATGAVTLQTVEFDKPVLDPETAL